MAKINHAGASLFLLSMLQLPTQQITAKSSNLLNKRLINPFQEQPVNNKTLQLSQEIFSDCRWNDMTCHQKSDYSSLSTSKNKHAG